MTQTTTPAPAAPAASRAARRRLVGALVWSGVAPFAVWALARLLGLERGYPAVQLMAFTPYVAAASLVPVVVAAATRRWRALAVAALTMLTLVMTVLPRWVADPDSRAGVPLRIMSSNVLAGAADNRFLVGLVRERRVDVLVLQEYTPGTERELAAAGLGDLLPHRVSFPVDGVEGSAVYARFPLRDGALRVNPGGFQQARATLVPPGAAPLEVESVHPSAPYNAETTALWKQGLLRQQRATVDGRLRVLAGDFNATLDHAALRDLLGSGYRDAASVAGEGLTPTWPYHPPNSGRIPGVTIDHVFADERIGVNAFEVVTVTGTDHRTILADLTIP